MVRGFVKVNISLLLRLKAVCVCSAVSVILSFLLSKALPAVCGRLHVIGDRRPALAVDWPGVFSPPRSNRVAALWAVHKAAAEPKLLP